jgi:hypothetical protein
MEVSMTILFFVLSIALACQWVAIARLHRRVDYIRAELDRQAGAIRGMKLIFQMMSKKARKK